MDLKKRMKSSKNISFFYKKKFILEQARKWKSYENGQKKTVVFHKMIVLFKTRESECHFKSCTMKQTRETKSK